MLFGMLRSVTVEVVEVSDWLLNKLEFGLLLLAAKMLFDPCAG